MRAAEKWPGLWQCPDYIKPLNDRPPFKFKCTGTIITQRGHDEFEKAVNKVKSEMN